MKKNSKLTRSFLGLIVSGIFVMFILLSFSNAYTGDPWKIPAKYKKMENPTTADKASLKIGKKLYRKHCASCHGKTGVGDGTKAADLDTDCGDLTSDEVKSQAAGVLYYKSFIGRDDMPSFEKKIKDDEDRWFVINYMLSL